MRKFLFILAVLGMTNSKAQLKTTDSTTVSTAALKRILTAAEQKKVLDGQVVILNDRIVLLQGIIDRQIDKDTATVGSYERQIAVMKEQRVIYDDQIKTFEKLLRREKRKRFFTGAAGMASTIAMIFLSLKK